MWLQARPDNALVKSDLTKEMPSLLKYITRLMAVNPDKAAKMLCSLAIDSKFESSSGKFYKFDGKEIKSNKYSYDKELQEKLWSISEQLSMDKKTVMTMSLNFYISVPAKE